MKLLLLKRQALNDFFLMSSSINSSTEYDDKTKEAEAFARYYKRVK